MKKIIIGILVFAVSFTGGYSLAMSKKMAAEMIQQDLLAAEGRVETKETLQPVLFAKDSYVEGAYRIAREIPEVLDKIFCYCYCEVNPHFKHKSLLTCYTDEHASRCGVCMREAYVAEKMTKEGKSPKEIAMYLRDYYLKR